MQNLELSEKELVLLYLLLKKKKLADPLPGALLTARIEKMLFEFMTIEEIENIEEFYRSL
jgi:hypothetical protein